MKRVQLKIALDEEGRLDRFLATRFPSWSRTALQRLINKRFVLVDDHPASPHHRLKTGQQISVRWPDVGARSPRLELGKDTPPLPFPILYEDDAILVVNKPAGLVVHPAAGHFDGNTLVEVLKSKLKQGPARKSAGGPWPDEMRPGLVHRLDRDTSGVIVLAKSPEAHSVLSKQFALRHAKKTYLALVKGRMPADEGVIESHLARHPGKRQRFAVSSARGRWASTKFRVIERFGQSATLVELQPLTGRTHQIRVHLASYGHPILGDHVYGPVEKEFGEIKRHMLHAAQLHIKHPESGEAMVFEAPLPNDFQLALKFIRSHA